MDSGSESDGDSSTGAALPYDGNDYAAAISPPQVYQYYQRRNEYSPAEDPINDVDQVKSPLNVYGFPSIRNNVVDEPPTQCLVDAATHGSSPVQSLPEHLMFAIFDFVRDAQAFVKCESVCRAFCGLLQSTEGIGRKLWEARPILYGNENVSWVPDDVAVGGRRVVLERVALTSDEVGNWADSVVFKFVRPALWTRIVTDLHSRCRPITSHLPSLELSDVFVKALTEIVESWVERLIKGALMCSVHRGSSTITAADIELARALTQDKTMPPRMSTSEPEGSWEPDIQRARRSDTTAPRTLRFSADALPELSVETKDRIIRMLVRRNRGVAYNGRAYELLWVLILARICKLLTRVAELVLYRHAPQDLMSAIGQNGDYRSEPAPWGVRLHTQKVAAAAAARRLRARTYTATLKDLAHSLKEDPYAQTYSWAEYRDDDDAADTSDDSGDEHYSIGRLSDTSDDDSSIRSSDLDAD